MKKNFKFQESGFITYVVVMVVLVTSVMMVTSSVQITKEAKRSINEAESKRTLEGAESGLEMALGDESVLPTGSISGVDKVTGKYDVKTEDSSNDKIPLSGVLMEEGDVLSLEEVNGDFTISWDSDDVALLITSIDNEEVAWFDLIEGSHDGGDPLYQNSIDSSSISTANPEVLRVRVLGGSTRMKLDCPSCGEYVARKIMAQASNDDDVQGRNTELYQSLPTAPSIFDFALYAETGISGETVSGT